MPGHGEIWTCRNTARQRVGPMSGVGKHAGIWRFDADKIGLTQEDGTKFATGIRSIVGMEWNPKDESLYAVGNGIDNFHTIFPDLFTDWQAAMLPSETLMKVTEGSDLWMALCLL